MPLSAEVIEALDGLRRSGQGAKQLFVAARRAGLDVTVGAVREYYRDEVQDRGEEQLHQEMPYRGKSYAEAPDKRWQADLALYRRPERGFVGFLLVVDVFTRALDAEPIRSKTANEVSRAFQAILRRYRADDPEHVAVLQDLILTTDLGNEFRGEFREYFVGQGGIWRTRAPGARNDLAVVDRAMGQLKKILRQECINRNTSNWPAMLPRVVDQWNETYLAPIHGSPEDVENNDEAYFLNLQDQARNFAHNHDNEERMEAAVMRHGRFRPPVITPEGFRNRVFSRRFAAPRRADHWETGVVVDTAGKQHTLKLVLPLGRDHGAAPEADPPAPGRFLRRLRSVPPKPRAGPKPSVAGRGRLDLDAAPVARARFPWDSAPHREPARADPPGLPGRTPRPDDIAAVRAASRGASSPPSSAAPAPSRRAASAPSLAPALPADPRERLAVLKRFRNVLLKLAFREPQGDDRAFFEKWREAMPGTRSQLDKAIREAGG